MVSLSLGFLRMVLRLRCCAMSVRGFWTCFGARAQHAAVSRVAPNSELRDHEVTILLQHCPSHRRGLEGSDKTHPDKLILCLRSCMTLVECFYVFSGTTT